MQEVAYVAGLRQEGSFHAMLRLAIHLHRLSERREQKCGTRRHHHLFASATEALPPSHNLEKSRWDWQQLRLGGACYVCAHIVDIWFVVHCLHLQRLCDYELAIAESRD